MYLQFECFLLTQLHYVLIELKEGVNDQIRHGEIKITLIGEVTWGEEQLEVEIKETFRFR